MKQRQDYLSSQLTAAHACDNGALMTFVRAGEHMRFNAFLQQGIITALMPWSRMLRRQHGINGSVIPTLMPWSRICTWQQGINDFIHPALIPCSGFIDTACRLFQRLMGLTLT